MFTFKKPLPHWGVALALFGALAGQSAQAAVEQYQITGDYSDGGSHTGTFSLTFGLDLNAPADYAANYPSLDYYFRTWTLSNVDMTFSGSGVNFVPLATESAYYQRSSGGNFSSHIYLYDADWNSAAVYLTAAFSDLDKPAVLGAQLRSSDVSSVETGDYVTVNFSNATAVAAAPVPEPETYAMLLAGLGVLGAVARLRKMAPHVAAA
jgi:hypothetical protein